MTPLFYGARSNTVIAPCIAYSLFLWPSSGILGRPRVNRTGAFIPLALRSKKVYISRLLETGGRTNVL